MSKITTIEIEKDFFDNNRKLRERVAELEAALSWVSVDERLPTEEGRYLAYHPDWMMEINTFYQGEFNPIGLATDMPTHWKPLPPEPQP